MQINIISADEILQALAKNARWNFSSIYDAIDEFDAPIYVTDSTGLITHFNSSCIEFAGRVPQRGKDRWCVTWRLYSVEGAFLPHDKCPMAEALNKGKAIRGVFAEAERPDGTRVTFAPFPTPVYDNSRSLVGGINALLNVSDGRQICELRTRSKRCQEIAQIIQINSVKQSLLVLAAEYDQAINAIVGATERS